VIPMTTTRVFASPGRYVQGPGVVGQLGSHVRGIGVKPLIITDDVVWDLTSVQIRASFEEAGLPVRHEIFGGRVTAEEIARLSAIARERGADVVIGLGGGSAVDIAKAVGDEAGTRWVCVPTTASTDAPTSGVTVLYSDSGAMVGARFFSRSPDLVLVDSQLIAGAPVSFFIAGVGDALATWLEARLSSESGAVTPAGGLATQAALALAELSWEVLHKHALPAIEAVRRHEVTDDVEAVIEANTLLSGLGFESGGLAAAHAIHDGVTTIPQTHGLQHGQKVNIGSIAQLILEGRPPTEIDDFIVFTATVGLPTSLTEIGLSVDHVEAVRQIATVAVNAPAPFIHALPGEVTVERVYDALLAVEVASARARASANLPDAVAYVAPPTPRQP